MLYALMNTDNTVASITSKTRGVEWGGAVIDNVELLLPSERHKFRVWSVTEDAGTQPENPVANGEEQIVDADAKTVTVRKLWRSKTEAELAADAKAKAAEELALTERPAVAIRKLEDVLARQDALMAKLVAKGVLTEEEAPAKPAALSEWEAKRKAERAKL